MEVHFFFKIRTRAHIGIHPENKVRTAPRNDVVVLASMLYKRGPFFMCFSLANIAKRYIHIIQTQFFVFLQIVLLQKTVLYMT